MDKQAKRKVSVTIITVLVLTSLWFALEINRTDENKTIERLGPDPRVNHSLLVITKDHSMASFPEDMLENVTVISGKSQIRMRCRDKTCYWTLIP